MRGGSSKQKLVQKIRLWLYILCYSCLYLCLTLCEYKNGGMGREYMGLGFCHVNAQLLTPSDMAVGRWKISLKRRDRTLLESMIFPSQKEPSVDVDVDVNMDMDAGESQLSLSRQRNGDRLRGRFDCDLILDGDGTFTLFPSELKSDGDNTDTDIDTDNNIDTCTSNQAVKQQHDNNVSGTSNTSKITTNSWKTSEVANLSRQPLRGYWKLSPNPYCVTDRHFDDLKLQSLSKVRVREHTITSNDGDIIASMSSKSGDKITIELNCSMWGRFGSNPIRHFLGRPRGKDAGRLTRGTMSIIKSSSTDGNVDVHEYDDMTPARRVLCGTFQGRRVPISNKDTGKKNHSEDISVVPVEMKKAVKKNASKDVTYGFV